MSALYAKAKEALLSAAIDLTTATVKAVLVKNTYPQDLVADQFYTAIAAYVVGAAQVLGGKSVAGGVFDATDIAVPAVAAGDTCEAVVLFIDTGVAGTSRLVAYIDVITGFPLATNGGDVNVAWDNGASKIFAL